MALCRTCRPSMRIIAALLVLVSLVLLSSCTEVYTPSDALAIRDFVLSTAGSSVKDAYYRAGALTLLGARDKLEAGPLCSMAASELSGDSVDLETAYYASQLLSIAGCSDGKAKAKAEEVALGSLDVEPKDISIGYHALSILAGLGRRASSEALDNALAPLQKLKASKGRMRASSKAAPSLTATALGYLTAAAAEKCGGIGSQHLPVVETLLNGIPLVLESVKGKGFLSDSDAHGLQAASLFTQGIDATCSDECSLDPLLLGELAKVLARARRVGTLQDAYYVLSAITRLTTTGKLPKPVALSLAAPTVAVDSGVVQVLVRNYGGDTEMHSSHPVSSLTGSLSRGMKGQSKELTFVSKGKGIYSASLSDLDIGLGSYQLAVTAVGENGERLAAETLPVTVAGKAEISKATLTVKKMLSVDYPDKLEQRLTLEPSSQLKVAFALSFPGTTKHFTPQQVFVSLRSTVTHVLATAAAKAAQGSGDYTATITPDLVAKQLGKQGGTFDVTITVGDEAIAEAVVWQVAAVEVRHAANGAAAVPVRSAADMDASQKPEIHHMFRKPDKRPPAIVSLAFAAIAAAPLGFLVLRLAQIGVNLKAWPSSGAGTLYSLAFHGGIGSILVLYTVFWLRLTLIETLLPLLVLSVFTFLSGYKALSHHAKTDLKKE